MVGEEARIFVYKVARRVEREWMGMRQFGKEGAPESGMELADNGVGLPCAGITESLKKSCHLARRVGLIVQQQRQKQHKNYETDQNHTDTGRMFSLRSDSGLRVHDLRLTPKCKDRLGAVWSRSDGL
jgi:hypothetical protein